MVSSLARLMPTSAMTRLFSFAQYIVFRQVGNKIPTNSIKKIMDLGFIVFERMGVKFPVVSAVYLQFYENVVQQETALAKVCPKDRVLVIGSGSLPATPILITRYSGAKVVTIDRDPRAVKSSTDYIRHQQLADRLTIDYGEGLTYPAKDFSVVFIMYGVKNTQDVIASLPNRISDDCRVVLRLLCDTNRKILDNLDITSYFTIKDQVHTSSLGAFETLLLEKKRG
jgi:precorrin-6B methylase 2